MSKYNPLSGYYVHPAYGRIHLNELNAYVENMRKSVKEWKSSGGNPLPIIGYTDRTMERLKHLPLIELSVSENIESLLPTLDTADSILINILELAKILQDCFLNKHLYNLLIDGILSYFLIFSSMIVDVMKKETATDVFEYNREYCIAVILRIEPPESKRAQMVMMTGFINNKDPEFLFFQFSSFVRDIFSLKDLLTDEDLCTTHIGTLLHTNEETLICGMRQEDGCLCMQDPQHTKKLYEQSLAYSRRLFRTFICDVFNRGITPSRWLEYLQSPRKKQSSQKKLFRYDNFRFDLLYDIYANDLVENVSPGSYDPEEPHADSYKILWELVSEYAEYVKSVQLFDILLARVEDLGTH